MKKFNVELYVQGKQLFEDVEANSKEEAIEKCKCGDALITFDKTYCVDEEAWEE